LAIFAYLLPVLFVVLQTCIAVLLLRGPFRRYPLLLAYGVIQILRFVLDGILFRAGGINSRAYILAYWTGDVIDDLLLFWLVAQLTYQVIEGTPLLTGVGRLLRIIPAAAVALSFVLYHPYFTSRWFRHTSQLLSLGAAVMNLLLWTGLLGRKGKRDHQLLMVSVGLGIAVTGYAISYGLLQFMTSKDTRWVPDLFKALTQVAGSAIWCKAFWPVLPKAPALHPPLQASGLNSAHSLPDS
jgi:hypothetical protein